MRELIRQCEKLLRYIARLSPDKKRENSMAISEACDAYVPALERGENDLGELLCMCRRVVDISARVDDYSPDPAVGDLLDAARELRDTLEALED